ncbi:MAG: patatin-like phospholipase family protein, partial [Pseudomonadota bacterium]
SVIDAARASSAVPVLFQAIKREDRWLVDGALANPLPITLARHLGADRVIAIDLNAHPRVLDRFNAPPAGPPVVYEQKAGPIPTERLPDPIRNLIDDTQRYVSEQIEFARARQRAKPQFFETAFAAVDIFQSHLSAANAKLNPPDVHIKPRVQDAPIDAFDNCDPFIEEGYRAAIAARAEIEAMLKRKSE